MNSEKNTSGKRGAPAPSTSPDFTTPAPIVKKKGSITFGKFSTPTPVATTGTGSPLTTDNNNNNNNNISNVNNSVPEVATSVPPTAGSSSHTTQGSDSPRSRSASVSSVGTIAEDPPKGSRWPTFEDWYNLPLEGQFFPSTSDDGKKNDVVERFPYLVERENKTVHERSGLWAEWSENQQNRDAKKMASYIDAVAVWIVYDKARTDGHKQTVGQDIAAFLITREPHNKNSNDPDMHLTASLFIDETPPSAINLKYVGTLHLYINRFRDVKGIIKNQSVWLHPYLSKYKDESGHEYRIRDLK